MRSFLAVFISIALSGACSAATVVERNARGSTYYNDWVGFGRTGTIMTVSTLDNWVTASFDIRIRTNIGNGADESMMFVYLFDQPGRESGRQFGSLDIKGGTFNAMKYNDLTYAMQYDVVNNQRASLISGASLYSNEAGIWDFLSTDIWDFLSTGRLAYEQHFFGNEFSHAAIFNLDDRSTSSYTFMLGDAAAVPLPGSAALLASGLILLARRRSAILKLKENI